MGHTRRQPPEGWATKVLLNLSAEDLGVLLNVAKPNEPRAHTYLRLARQAVLPADTMLRYRLAPDHPQHKLFPDWRVWGPFTPVDALDRGSQLMRKGYEVETIQVDPKPPPPAWDEPEEEDPLTCEKHGCDYEGGECPECLDEAEEDE